MTCPECGAEDMILHPGETYDGYTEPDMFSCPDCGTDVMLDK